jgi:hypothetical protein
VGSAHKVGPTSLEGIVVQNYTLTNSNGDPMTVQIEDDEAARLGLIPVETKAHTPRNKQATPKNKANGTPRND